MENDGWFPVYTVGAGVDSPFRRGGDWYGIVGIAYYWGRLDHDVKAEGSLAPARATDGQQINPALAR